MGTTKNRCKETERRRRKKRRKKDKRLKRLKGMWRPISERENKRKRESSRNFLLNQTHTRAGAAAECASLSHHSSLSSSSTPRGW